MEETKAEACSIFYLLVVEYVIEQLVNVRFHSVCSLEDIKDLGAVIWALRKKLNYVICTSLRKKLLLSFAEMTNVVGSAIPFF